jgi:hypothetical protein
LFEVENIPDGHVWAGNNWKADGSRETLVTLGIIVLQADLEFDGLEEVSLLGLERVLKKTLYVATHSGCGTDSISIPSPATLTQRIRRLGKNNKHTDCDFRHDDSLPVELIKF